MKIMVRSYSYVLNEILYGIPNGITGITMLKKIGATNEEIKAFKIKYAKQEKAAFLYSCGLINKQEVVNYIGYTTMKFMCDCVGLEEDHTDLKGVLKEIKLESNKFEGL